MHSSRYQMSVIKVHTMNAWSRTHPTFSSRKGVWRIANAYRRQQPFWSAIYRSAMLQPAGPLVSYLSKIYSSPKCGTHFARAAARELLLIGKAMGVGC